MIIVLFFSRTRRDYSSANFIYSLIDYFIQRKTYAGFDKLMHAQISEGSWCNSVMPSKIKWKESNTTCWFGGRKWQWWPEASRYWPDPSKYFVVANLSLVTCAYVKKRLAKSLYLCMTACLDKWICCLTFSCSCLDIISDTRSECLFTVYPCDFSVICIIDVNRKTYTSFSVICVIDINRRTDT